MAATWTTYWTVARDGDALVKWSASRSADGYYLTTREPHQTTGGSRYTSHFADLTYDLTPEGAVEKYLTERRRQRDYHLSQFELERLRIQRAETLQQTLAAQAQKETT